MASSPHVATRIVSYFLRKLASTYDMPRKNHMKYPLHQLHKFPVQGYASIVSVLI